MEYIDLKDNSYSFVHDFKDHGDLRALFNALTQATYGFDFEFWYESGFWGEQYIPYSLIHKGKMVSNVSVNKMEFIIENEIRRGIQIGTVMTDMAYRHRGLNRYLLERVIREWKDRVDFIYLFANNTVLDFYPKFNFERVDEYHYSKPVNYKSLSSYKKLDVATKNDRDLLINTIDDSIPIAKVSMRNNTGLIMFYCLSFMKNSVYYLEELEAAVLAEIKGDTLFLHDVFSKEQVDLNQIVQLMCDKTIKRVVLGFAPKDETGFEKSVLKPDDTLFVFGEQANYFKRWPWRFPVLSHA